MPFETNLEDFLEIPRFQLGITQTLQMQVSDAIQQALQHNDVVEHYMKLKDDSTALQQTLRTFSALVDTLNQYDSLAEEKKNNEDAIGNLQSCLKELQKLTQSGLLD